MLQKSPKMLKRLHKTLFLFFSAQKQGKTGSWSTTAQWAEGIRSQTITKIDFIWPKKYHSPSGLKAPECPAEKVADPAGLWDNKLVTKLFVWDSSWPKHQEEEFQGWCSVKSRGFDGKSPERSHIGSTWAGLSSVWHFLLHLVLRKLQHLRPLQQIGWTPQSCWTLSSCALKDPVAGFHALFMLYYCAVYL